MKKNWKKKIYLVCAIAVVFWVGFRVFSLIAVSNKTVFNEVRNDASGGIPVATMVAQNVNDSLQEPLNIRNNRALVTGARVGLFRAGQRVGGGEIVSVSSRIDIDSGMYVIKTRGVDDGLQYAKYTRNGYFVPVYAIVDDGVFVVQNDTAVYKRVIIARQDANRALVTQGLNEGDVVILSKVSDGEKVKLEESK